MRLRHIPGSEEEIAENPFVVSEPEEKKGRWDRLFCNAHPIEIEVGMGKGRFIMDMARRNPHVNYVGIERYASVLLRGLQKRAEEELPNLLFLCVDARRLPDIFEQGEVRRIYLNFSDPWPKDRHAKRRLTSEGFMKAYGMILAAAGTLEFKTDNRGLFDFSLESIPSAGWEIRQHTFDLHRSEMGEGNIMTEYEEKFSALGNPIFKLIAARPYDRETGSMGEEQ